jgi:hypothetical protein
MDAREMESWLARFRPDLVYYPRLEDLAFGVHPVMWVQSLRIDLPRIWVNSCTPPSSVRERLLIREMLIADGPVGHGTETAGHRRPAADNRGLRWLIHGRDDARAIARLRPTFAEPPRFGRLTDDPGDRTPFGPAAALAAYLAGAIPLDVPPLVIDPAAGPRGRRLPHSPLPISMLPSK